MPDDNKASSSLTLDAFSPQEIAQRVENAAISKANISFASTLILAILAGAFIAFGGAFYTLVITGSGLGFGPTRMLGGLAFSTGLVLVVVGGAELFTGNNLIVMAWADRKITHLQLFRNWSIVYIGNLLGSLGIALLVAMSGILALDGGNVALTAIGIAEAKLNLPMDEAFVRGILCNTLVCLAIWLCFSARSVVSKILAIVFPITAFVALGFEHSIANMYLIPIAYFAGSEAVTFSGFVTNIILVTAGNIIGGSGFVAITYWMVYLRKS